MPATVARPASIGTYPRLDPVGALVRFGGLKSRAYAKAQLTPSHPDNWGRKFGEGVLLPLARAGHHRMAQERLDALEDVVAHEIVDVTAGALLAADLDENEQDGREDVAQSARVAAMAGVGGIALKVAVDSEIRELTKYIGQARHKRALLRAYRRGLA